MNRTFQLALFVFLLLSSCSKKELAELELQDADIESEISARSDGTTPLSPDEIFQIAVQMEEDSGEDFDWSMVDDFTLWSAIAAGDGSLCIGYTLDNQPDISDIIHLIDVNSPAWTATRDEIIDFILNGLKASDTGGGLTIDDLEIKHFEGLPIMTLRLNDADVIGDLRNLITVRYIEPWEFDLEDYFTKGNSGCSDGDEKHDGFDVFPTGLYNTAYNCKVSWHLGAHNIPEAWDELSGAGDGVKIGLIDTGVSPTQDRLKNPGFTYGYSNNRSIISGGILPYTHGKDQCGHGTSMAGQMTAPVNDNGAIVGIAHQADLRSIRVGDDVLISRGQKKAFADAIKAMADDPDVKVVNISMGRKIKYSSLTDAVDYAYNKGLLMSCAAGTWSDPLYFDGIYPAKYHKTIASTGVKYRPDDDPNGNDLRLILGNSTNTHVTFSTYIKHNGEKLLTMQETGNAPKGGGGSSSASATTTGIAALILAANPNLSRHQLLNIMKKNASYYDSSAPFLGKDKKFGFGIIDAEAAVTEASNFSPVSTFSVLIDGPTSLPSPQSVTWTAQVNNPPGAVNYAWYWNNQLVSTAPSYSRNVQQGGGNTTVYQLKVEVSSGADMVNNIQIITVGAI